MKTWIMTDTHLNHAKIKTYCDRPDDHTEQTNKNVCALVGPKDILIHLGDVGMDKPETWTWMVKAWPGKKWLVRGNHDQKSCQWYVENELFDMACDAMLYRGVWLTHRPWPGELPKGAQINVHGHLHNVWDGFHPDDPEKDEDEFTTAARSGKLLRPWQRLLSHEYVGYKPVDFDKFVSRGHKMYQSTEPNAETKQRMALKYAEKLKQDAEGLNDGKL